MNSDEIVAKEDEAVAAGMATFMATAIVLTIVAIAITAFFHFFGRVPTKAVETELQPAFRVEINDGATEAHIFVKPQPARDYLRCLSDAVDAAEEKTGKETGQMSSGGINDAAVLELKDISKK